jgi:hypothetical protein
VRYLLDTNVISEWIKPRPDAGVVAWLDAADEDALHLSVDAPAAGPRLRRDRSLIRLSEWAGRAL